MEEQCRGATKSGRRCKNRTNLVDGYCRVHRDQAVGREAPSRPEPEGERRAERRMEQPAEPRTRRAAGPKPESPSRPREPHSRTPVSGRDDERNRWLGGLVAGLLLALATLVVARLGRRRR